MKKLCATFINALNNLNNRNITTREELLMDPAMHTEFWCAVERFVSFALGSKTSKKNKKGEIRRGNKYMIDELAERGVASKEDIHLDCVIKIMSKLDKVLMQHPVEKQHNYAYNICNHLVCDQFDLLPPEDVEIISLQETIKNKSVSPENTCTYEDMIGDYSYNGESCYAEQETIDELTTILQNKRAAERENERNEVVSEIKQLAKKPAEVLVHMATAHLGIKPRELAERIATKGGEVTYAEILFDVAKKVDLEISELRSLVKNVSFSEKSIKADTKDVKVIAKQVSRLVWRAKDNLKK